MMRLFPISCRKRELKNIFGYHKHIQLKEHKCLNPNGVLNLRKSAKFSVPNRNIFTSVSAKSKIFADKENDYAFEVIQRLPVAKTQWFQMKSSNENISSLDEFNARLDQNWRSKSASEIVQCFRDSLDYCVANNITMADNRFDKLVDGLVDHIQDITDEELSQLLQCLAKYPPTESFKSHNFHDIWSALDDLCCWKLPYWSFDKMFHYAELWYNLNLGRICNFSVALVTRLHKNCHKLNKAHIVRAFFYLNVCRRQHLEFSFEAALEKYAHLLSSDEMAVITMGFFKSQKAIRSKYLLDRMIKKVKEDHRTITNISLCAILKALRYSMNPALMDQMIDLLDHLTDEIDRLSNICCLHIALLGTSLQFFHEKSVSKICHKLVKEFHEVDKIRLKDIERLLLVLTMFDFDPKTDPDIFQAAFQELHNERRQAEMVKHPKCLPCALHYLSIRGMYSYELMNKILDPEFILEVYGKNPKSLARELFCLDPCIEIECLNYTGNRLRKEQRHRACKWLTESTPSYNQFKKLTAADKLILDVVDTVKKIVFHTNCYCVDYILPHFSKPDVIVCKNKKTEEFVEICGLENYELGDVMYPSKREDHVWYAIVVIGWNNTLRNTSKPLGLNNLKYRHLEKVGYHPIFVIWNEFMPLNEQDKINYIVNKLC